MGALKGQIRPIAIAIIKNKGRILVSPGYDEVKKLSFYRLLGGGIDFGESVAGALSREFKEELDAELTNCRLIKVSENIFDFNGEPYHEICFIHEAEFADPALYEKEEFRILDAIDDDGNDGKVIWLDISDLKDKNIFPEGVKELI